MTIVVEHLDLSEPVVTITKAPLHKLKQLALELYEQAMDNEYVGTPIGEGFDDLTRYGVCLWGCEGEILGSVEIRQSKEGGHELVMRHRKVNPFAMED